MIKVVLDANVFISGLLSQSGPPHEILNWWLDGQIRVFTTPQIKEELSRVVTYPRIHDRLTKLQVTKFLAFLENFTFAADGTLKVEILSVDPSDNIYLACAVEVQAQYLVTGNLDHFLEAGEFFRDVRIVTPRHFTEIVKSTSSGFIPNQQDL